MRCEKVLRLLCRLHTKLGETLEALLKLNE